MRHRRSFALLVPAVLLLGVSCGGDEDPPAATAPPAATESPQPGPITPGAVYTTGTATANVTGNRTETFEAALDSDAEIGFGDDEDFEIDFVNPEGWMIRLDFTPPASGTGQADDAWVAIGMPGSSIADPEYYYDAFETQCETTLTQFDAAGVAGSYSCDELPNGEEQTIDVQGTFSIAV